MSGPPPKPAAKRRRRNESPSRTKLGPGKPAARGKAPALPPRKRPLTWAASTREWWKTIWASPMAVVWIDADVPALVRLATLQNEIYQGGEVTGTLLGEIRQLEDRFGLSPLARRRLEWEIGHATVEKPAMDDPTESPAKDGRWLRAVK